jgi:microcystin-dependent protein
VGAQVYTYDTGTLTPKTVYKDKALTVPHPNPILTTASGRIPSFWTGGNDYRARIIDPGGNVIDDIDGIQGDTAVAAVGGGGGTGTSPIITGDVIWAYTTGFRSGWVRLNGRTIGSAVSGATERANADCYALFILLWNSNTGLTVSGGRGATADADWTANKTIALPDGRASALFGLDDMGSTAAGRLVGSTFGSGSATMLGSLGGTGAETLLASQIPAHSHTGTTDGTGSHSHTGTTAAAGSHSHGGITGLAGAHSHNYAYVAPNTYSGIAASGGAGGYWNGGPTNPINTTPAAPDHQHSISADGSHTHTFTSDAAGFHSHTFTSAQTGGGLAHNNMPPFLLGTFYMKL